MRIKAHLRTIFRDAIQAHRRRHTRRIIRRRKWSGPDVVQPIWPLPRCETGPTGEEIRAGFAKYESWHYAYEFEGGLSFPARIRPPIDNYEGFQDLFVTVDPKRPLQRFRHFMPWLLQAVGGSLLGKRVLDIACNSGFWSFQCALLGAGEVVGFDARPELIEQANMVRSIVGVGNVRFQVTDFWKMTPEGLGGRFDVVLNLGLLYHLPNPLGVMQMTKSVASHTILLDTAVYTPITDWGEALLRVRWEEPEDIRDAASSGIVMRPNRRGIDLIMKHVGFHDWMEIPIRSTDMPDDYLDGSRASWMIRV